MHIYPFAYARYEDVEQVMTSLSSYDRDKWASAWSSTAKPYEEKAAQAEKVGDTKSARFFEAAHMGFTKDTNKIITDWIYEKLS